MTVTVVVALAAIVLLIVIGLIAYSRRPRQDAGLTSFRRHIDALSPESRREVMDRVRPSNHADDDDYDDDRDDHERRDGRVADEASGTDSQEPTD